MTAMDIADVMSAIETELDAIPGLRVFGFPPKSAQPPFAFVNMPDSIDYDLTFGRGQDRFTLSVTVGVADQVDRSAAAAQCDYASTSTANSIKTAIEEGALKLGHHGVRVTQAQFGQVVLAAGQYAGVTFQVDVGA